MDSVLPTGTFPRTPASKHGQKSQSPTSVSRPHDSSHKRLSFRAWKSPLKSLRSHRIPNVSDDHSPRTVKCKQSIFSVFHSIRSLARDNAEPIKYTVIAERPKTTSPSKGNATDYEDCLIKLKRRKSFSDFLGTVTNRVTSKNNTVSRRSERQVEINHKASHFGSVANTGSPSNNNLYLNSKYGNAKRFTTLVQQQQCFHQIVPGARVESDSKTTNTDSAFLHRLDAGMATLKTPRFKSTTCNAANDVSIAERIRLTVNEMTQNRYWNPSPNSFEQKYIDRVLEDSVDLNTPLNKAPTSYSTSETAPRIAVKNHGDIKETPLEIAQNSHTVFNPGQRPKGSDLTYPKLRDKDGKTTLPSSKRSRKVSTAPVRVKFPDTKTGAGYTGIYESSSKAISDVFEKSQGQLSNLCTYDCENRTIQAYPLECPPNMYDLRKRGLETIWLPMQDEPGNRSFQGSIIADELQFQKDRPLNNNITSSGLDSRSFSNNPLVGCSLSRQSRTSCQLANTISNSRQLDSVTPAELSRESDIFSLLIDENGPSNAFSQAHADILTTSASTYDNCMKMQPKAPAPRYPDSPSQPDTSVNSSYRTYMDSPTSFLWPDSPSSTQADPGSPRSTCVSSESSSEQSSECRVEFGSEIASRLFEQLSGSYEQYDKIIIDHTRDLVGIYPQEHSRDNRIKREVSTKNRGCADTTWNADMRTNFGSWRDCMHISPLSQRPCYMEASEMSFDSRYDDTTRCYPTHSAESSEDIEDWRTDWWKMRAVQTHSYLSRCSQSISATGDEEPTSDVSLASGFAFTRYAAQLLENGGRSGSDCGSDSTNEDERQRPMVSRSSSEAKSLGSKKAEQTIALPISQLDDERQASAVLSTTLRHGPSNFANHLPDIDEGSESDGTKCIVNCLVNTPGTSPDKFDKGAHSDKPSEDTISSSCKVSQVFNKAVPTENAPFSFGKREEISNDLATYYELIQRDEEPIQPYSSCGDSAKPLMPFASDELNIRISGKEMLKKQVPNLLAAKERKKVAGLVEIFQARGMIGPGLKSVLPRRPLLSNPIHQSCGRSSTSLTRIVSPPGTVYTLYTPSGVIARTPVYPSAVRRAPISHSFVTRPDSGLSDVNTEASSMFGEELERSESSPVESSEGEGQEVSEEQFRDSLIYG